MNEEEKVNDMEQETVEEPVKKKSKESLQKQVLEKIRGRIVIFDEENSEFAKNLSLTKKGDYQQKK